jgi:murein DD-endopeptidase MepM/ murein hydrolase activator NlpD
MASNLLFFQCWSSLGVRAVEKNQGRDNFFKVIGASRDSDVYPCADYAARRNYMGEPYYIRVPETGKVTARHEGMDFCGLAGVDVLSPASGVIVDIVEDNPYRGGECNSTNVYYLRPLWNW